MSLSAAKFRRTALAATRSPRQSTSTAPMGNARHSHDVHMAFGPEDKTLFDEKPDADASDDEDLTFAWDEEKSILAFLMEEGPRQSDQDRIDALVGSLKAPFEAKSKQLREQLAENFIPAVRQVQKVNRLLDTTVDADSAKGITVFNSACKAMDAASLAEYEEITEAYETARDNIAHLMEQLQAEYTHRDCLWVDLEKKVDEIADPALIHLQDLPGEVERIIAKLDKGYDAMQNQGKETTGFSEKRLKDLLNKLGDSSLAL